LRVCQGGKAKRHKLAPQGASERDIFHERQFRISACSGECFGSDQQRLVAVRQTEEARAQIGPTRNEAGRCATGGKSKLTKACFGRGGLDMVKHRPTPSCFQNCVCVQDQKPSPLGSRNATGNLSAPPCGPSEPNRACGLSYGCCFVH
jgi:hypothetical protein